jgi:hypothetical protein
MESNESQSLEVAATASPTQARVEETVPLNEEQIEAGFVSEIPWEDEAADCVVICCSDPSFEKQNEDFVKALGFSQPHRMQIPSGVAVFASLVAAANFLHKGMGLLLKKAIDLTGVETVICIGHEDCGGYKSGKHRIVQAVSRRLAGKPLREVQHDHLRKAGKTISRQFGGDVEVRVFYADVVQEQAGDRVKYVHVATFGSGRRRGAAVG